MTSAIFGTKAETLQHLRPLLKHSHLLPQFYFEVEKWKNDWELIIKQLYNESWAKNPMIVRSSSLSEDTDNFSAAGKFTSVLNVMNMEDCIKAIEEVINSYGKSSNKDQVLVQPMLMTSKLSGVAFTSTLDTFAPYYVINYDDSGSTDSVTSGNKNELKTYIFFKGCSLSKCKKRFHSLVIALEECERLFDNNFLDIEFAIDSENNIYIFQVRPIVLKHKPATDLTPKLNNLLRKLHSKIAKISNPHPNLLGDHAYYGTMPDWNPAEIIGVRPRKLALSLYKEFVTDKIWAYQRDNYGYRNLRSHPLMVTFSGIPFIDVRVSFNSFIPKKLDDKIAVKLVQYYLQKLKSNPHHHDKVEFEIIHSCVYLNLHDKLSHLLQEGFSSEEIVAIESSLLEITNKVIHMKHGLYKKDISKIEILNGKYNDIVNSNLSVVDKVYWLIEDCKRYGTLPFAGIARAAFIGVQFLRSFVETKIITREEYYSFLNSLNTVSKQLNKDLQEVKSGKITKTTFLNKYGHLRPGTYDILSPRYDENFEGYFSTGIAKCESSNFIFSKEQKDKITESLIQNNINVDIEELLLFIKGSVEGREYAKFIFSRSLSQVLKYVEVYGKRIGLDKEALSFLDIQEFLDLYSSLDHEDINDVFEKNIEHSRDVYKYSQAILLPDLIVSPEDIYSFIIGGGSPNFITMKRVKAEIISKKDFIGNSLAGKIAFIPSADPGYDYLFTQNIAGLVTEYGGMNSHMAIRCAELGLPAIIGAGRNFYGWQKASVLEIDCSNRKVRIIT